MDLDNDQQANLCFANRRRFHLDRVDHIGEALKELSSHGLYQSDILEHDFEELTVLVVIILLVIRVYLNLTPLRECNPLQHDVTDLENPVTDTSR